MSTLSVNNPTKPLAERPLPSALKTLVIDLVGTIRTALAAERTYRALSNLSDHQLADIGLQRDELARAVFDRYFR